jgi:hypothetical protein
MTGFLRRLSGNPPNMAMRGFFFSRWIVNCRHFRGPSGVFVVALRRFDSFVVLVWFLLAKVFRSDVSASITAPATWPKSGHTTFVPWQHTLARNVSVPNASSVRIFWGLM